MTDRTYRGRPEPALGEPAVLNGVRTDSYSGKEVHRSMRVDSWKGQQSFSIDGWQYRVVSVEKSVWDQEQQPPLWAFVWAQKRK